MWARWALIEVCFPHLFEDITAFDECQSLSLGCDGMLRQILDDAAVICRIFDLQLCSPALKEVNEILPVNLYHGAAQFCTSWQPSKDFLHHWGHKTVVVAEHRVGLATACAAICENGRIVALKECTGCLPSCLSEDAFLLGSCFENGVELEDASLVGDYLGWMQLQQGRGVVGGSVGGSCGGCRGGSCRWCGCVGRGCVCANGSGRCGVRWANGRSVSVCPAGCGCWACSMTINTLYSFKPN